MNIHVRIKFTIPRNIHSKKHSRSSGEKRKKEWEKSLTDPQEFWADKAKAIDWFKPFSKVLDDSNVLSLQETNQ